MKKRNKAILVILGIIVVIYLGVYTVLTPFIRGVVVDETTKQPVEDAWVMATATIGTRTIAGDTGGTYAISCRHLRTGKEGVFYVFPQLYPSIPTPFTFGNMKKSLNVTVRVMDGRRAEMNLTRGWWKRLLFVSIPVQQDERKIEDIRLELANIYSYCTDGMFFPIYRYGSQLCDDWELDYAIALHESFITRLGEPKNIAQDVLYTGAMGRLAHLYERKGEYKKALATLVAVRDFMKKNIKLICPNTKTRSMQLKKK